ncbi:LacI family transcriptional regulator [Clostridia bacterium]|nr:LacI family transcriptional regulator [Clostridia bacterium]
MPSTILDIAALTGISKSTVSRYLNKGSVGKNSAQVIESAIKQLDYAPNINARRLVSHKSGILGIVIDDISDYIYGAMLSGIQSAANEHGFMCTFFSRKPTQAAETSYLHLFAGGQVDGLLFASFRKRNPDEVRLLIRSGQPIVLIGEHSGEQRLSSVDVDNLNGTMEEVLHIIKQGHRRIAYLAGPEPMSASAARLRGYQKALEISGIELDPDLVEQIGWSVLEGERGAKILLARTNFTSLVGSNSFCTYGAMTALQAAGYRVPEDISVAGFDDDLLTTIAKPALTTLSQPFARIGSTAVEQLVRLIAGESEQHAAIYIQPKLIVRESTGIVQQTEEAAC